MWTDRQTDSRIQVQLEEDGGGSTRQSWMIETSGLVPPAASHAGLSIARRLAVARPKLSGRRSSSTVLSQVFLGLPVLRRQSLGGPRMQARRAREWS